MEELPPRFRFDEYVLDPAALALTRNGEPVALRRKTLLVFVHLVENRHRVVSKEELLACAWPGLRVEMQAVFQSISELRAVFGDCSCIRTVRGIGYQWLAPTAADAPAPAGGQRPRGRPRLQATFAAALSVGLLLASPGPLTPADDAQHRSPAAIADAQRLFEQSRDYLLQEQTATARRLLRLALERNPRHLEAKLYLAELHFGDGRVDIASRLGSEVYEASLDYGSDHLRMAAAGLLSRLSTAPAERQRAEDYAREALAIARQLHSPLHAAAGHERLGELYLAAGDHRLAKRELHKALAVYGDNVCPDSERRVRTTLAKLALRT